MSRLTLRRQPMQPPDDELAMHIFHRLILSSNRPQNQNQQNKSIQRCQKCLEFGHGTWECKGTAKYVARPSRTQQLKNPALRQGYLAASEVPDEFNDKKEAAKKEEEKAREKREKKRKAKASPTSSSSSDSDSDSDTSSSETSSSGSGTSSGTSSGSSSSSGSDSSDSSGSGSDASGSEESGSSDEKARKRRKR